MLVVAMIAALAFVVGALIGVGGLLGYLKADPTNPETFGIEAAGEEVTCAPCAEATSAPNVYGLVYPVEQSLIIEGDLDREVLRQHVIKNRLKLQKCYQDRLNADASIKGEMQIQFTLAATGAVVAKVVRVDTTEDAPLKSCVLDIIGEWRFEKKVSKQTVVKVDVIFAPLGGAR
jgi:hypothetical protein